MSRIELCIQIEEETLVEGLSQIREAFSQFDGEFPEVYSLLNRIGGADRFPDEPGCEDNSDDLDDEEEEEDEDA